MKYILGICLFAVSLGVVGKVDAFVAEIPTTINTVRVLGACAELFVADSESKLDDFVVVWGSNLPPKPTSGLVQNKMVKRVRQCQMEVQTVMGCYQDGEECFNFFASAKPNPVHSVRRDITVCTGSSYAKSMGLSHVCKSITTAPFPTGRKRIKFSVKPGKKLYINIPLLQT